MCFFPHSLFWESSLDSLVPLWLRATQKHLVLPVCLEESALVNVFSID